MYTCTRCGACKPADAFSGLPRNRWCRTCSAAYQKELRTRSPGYRGSGRNKALVALENRPLRDWLARAILTAAGNCRKLRRPLPTITLDELLALHARQSGMCAISGLPLLLERGSPWALSLDQITQAGGYAQGNVRLVTWAANRARGDLSDADLLRMCTGILKLGSGLSGLDVP